MRKRILLLSTLLALELQQAPIALAMENEDENSFSQRSITIPQITSVLRTYSHLDIKPFLEYLKGNKGKSFPDIASAVNGQVQIDPRVPHPLNKKSKGTSTTHSNLRPGELSLSLPKPLPLGFKIDNKFTWPTKGVIEDFAKEPNHCTGKQADIEKRKFLWEKLTRAYEQEFNDFKQQRLN